MYDKECLKRIKESANLLEIVHEYIPCKRVGNLFKALCPFHQEKNPSFIIHESGSHYHCFGCGAHGDVISFLMGAQNYSFRDAIEWLSDKYSIPLFRHSRSSCEDQQVDGKKLRDCLKEAAHFFHVSLFYTERGRRALNYLIKKRGLDLSDCIRFGIGFAPARDVRDFFPENSFSFLKEAGLCKDSGRFFFADRIVFPISTWTGHVVGFTARQIQENKSSTKYINTPDTILFKKSEQFFGLNCARSAIAQSHSVYLVEGPLDAIRLIQNGIENTLALLGSSLTKMHVNRLLDLGVQRIYLVPDGDHAGLAASKKWGDLLIQNLIDVRIVQLPQGSDPDTFLLQNGLDGWKERFDASLDYISYLFHQAFPRPPTFSEKTKWIKSMLELISSWKDPILIQTALQQLSDLTHIERPKLAAMGKSGVSLACSPVSETSSRGLLEKEFIKLAIFLLSMDPNLIKKGLETVEDKMLLEDLSKRVRSAIIQVQAGEEVGLVSLMIVLDEKDVKEVENLGRPIYPPSKAKECFKHLCKELVKRDWLLQKEQVRMEIQSGRLKDEEAVQLAQELVRMGQVPPESTF